MLFRRQGQDQIVSTEEVPGFGDFHEWVLSLPWVVERPYSLETPGVRCFGVECEPLGRRQLWLVTGLDGHGRPTGSPSITVIVPSEAANDIEDLGWGRPLAPMPRGYVLLTVDGPAFDRQRDLEALVLNAYGYAMS